MPMGLMDMVRRARDEVDELSAQEVKEGLDAGEVDLVIDVREPEEWSAGHVAGAVNVPRGVLELRADASLPVADPALTEKMDSRVVVYCMKAPGARSLLAAQTLQRMGYSDVVAMTEGFSAWHEAGLPAE